MTVTAYFWLALAPVPGLFGSLRRENYWSKAPIDIDKVVLQFIITGNHPLLNILIWQIVQPSLVHCCQTPWCACDLAIELWEPAFILSTFIRLLLWLHWDWNSSSHVFDLDWLLDKHRLHFLVIMILLFGKKGRSCVVWVVLGLLAKTTGSKHVLRRDFLQSKAWRVVASDYRAFIVSATEIIVAGIYWSLIALDLFDCQGLFWLLARRGCSIWVNHLLFFAIPNNILVFFNHGWATAFVLHS